LIKVVKLADGGLDISPVGYVRVLLAIMTTRNSSRPLAQALHAAHPLVVGTSCP
jgi:hypothetical protein